MLQNSRTLSVQAVKLDGSPVGAERRISANFKGVTTVAANVLDGTRFRLKFGSPGFNLPFTISGRTTY
jgi:hypothetical protein